MRRMDISRQLWDIEYFNCELFEITDTYVQGQTITSLAILLYSKNIDNKNIFSEIHDKLQLINKSLRNDQSSKYQKFIDNCDNMINNSPTIDKDIIVYRGISCELDDIYIGKVIDNNGFMFCSLDYNTATYFLNDTKDCYTYCGEELISSDREKCRTSNNGTFLEILLLKGTHFLDVSYYQHGEDYVFSQIVLSSKVKLKVIDIKREKINMGNWRRDLFSDITFLKTIVC